MTSSKVHPQHVFNVREFGASGYKDDNAQPAIQQAIDACSQSGGGMVFVPPGSYTTGTLMLRSNIRFHIEAGATLYSSKNPADFTQRGLFYAEDVDNIALEGLGTVDGQAEYEWRITDMRDWYIYPNQLQAEAAGLPLNRSFPTANSIGHLVLFVRCRNVHIQDLTFLHSPSWTMHLWGCEHLVIDGLTIRTSLRDGVWADGIDPDGCKDVRISNCTIETGDDALVFYSSNIYGPARPCENITVTNCRLTSSSSALKFCDGNQNAIRNVTISDCVITNSNRGVAFMVFDGGILENVIISNLTIECKRYDWFWWGDGDPIHFNLIQRSEIDSNIDKSKEPKVGVIRNILLKNVFAKGEGSCLIHGHVNSPLENVTLEDITLELACRPESAPRRFEHGIRLENARDFKMRNVEIKWMPPESQDWRSALVVNHVENLVLDGLSAKQAQYASSSPAVEFNEVTGARLQNSYAQPGTGIFLKVNGSHTQDVLMVNNQLENAVTPLLSGADLGDGS